MKRRALVLASPLALAGCAGVGRPDGQAILSGAEFRVVTAFDAAPGRGPIGISDRFPLDGKMVAFVSINWPADHAAWGTLAFESRWYSGDRLIIKRQTDFTISRSPFSLWSSVLPIALGPGKGRYELHADGRMWAEHAFEIVTSAPPAGPAGPVGPRT